MNIPIIIQTKNPTNLGHFYSRFYTAISKKFFTKPSKIKATMGEKSTPKL
jgi:hypothetical protein